MLRVRSPWNVLPKKNGMVKRIQVFAYVFGNNIVEKKNSRVNEIGRGRWCDHLFGENKLNVGCSGSEILQKKKRKKRKKGGL